MKRWSNNSKRRKIVSPKPDMLWFRKYFMLALKCVSPIVEAFEHGSTRVVVSGYYTKKYFMDDMFCMIDSDVGTETYYKNNQIHRDGYPAIISLKGWVEWYDQGVLYARETPEDGMSWYDRDKRLHRTDGPARETRDGIKYWLHHGYEYREDGPAIEFANGVKIWVHTFQRPRKTSKIHRTDGPAILIANGDKIWIQRDVPHREDGPAIECISGYKAWYERGKCLREENANSRKITYRYGCLDGIDGFDLFHLVTMCFKLIK
jgi:hypothetical protein